MRLQTKIKYEKNKFLDGYVRPCIICPVAFDSDWSADYSIWFGCNSYFFIIFLQEIIVYSFILGAIFGIVISTVGFTGVMGILDKGVDKTKEFVQQAK